MSFSKAKIQRFNDIKDCTPSPAKYNVAVQDKVKLGFISQSGTFVKKATSLSGSETGSIHSTPCFQTPIVPKKKKFLGISTFKTKPPSSAGVVSTTTGVDPEELREKIVECSNKDVTINDLHEQIEEMKEKIGSLEKEKNALIYENGRYAENLSVLKKQQEDMNSRYQQLHVLVKDINFELRIVKQQSEALKVQTLHELNTLQGYVDKFQDFHSKIIKEQQDEALKKEETLRQSHTEEMANLKHVLNEEIQETVRKHQETEAKLRLVEENFKEVSLLTEMQMKQKMEEVESSWKLKLEEKEKESAAILKECQEISEYNIIQSEIEKNQMKNLLSEKESSYNDILEKYKTLETEHGKTLEEMSAIRSEKHAYELSITTFRDTIEVLKKRLINSDRDVEQLKEELGKCEETVLGYEAKIVELKNQLSELQTANEELEMQYESTSKIMQNQVKSVEKSLLDKVENLQAELKQLSKDKELLNEVLAQYHQQQDVIGKAQQSIAQSSVLIEDLESKQVEVEEELEDVKSKLVEETEEAAQIRKKYIETSGKYDKLSQEFEKVSLELKRTKEKNEELQNLIGPYQEQLEAYDHELKVIMNEKETIANQAKELTTKYADILGHQNHQQKVKHLTDLKVKSTELFEKNLDLESRNYKLTKTVEKLKKELEELKRGGSNKKMKFGSGNKENLGSPKCTKGIQSPGPLKDKNTSLV